MSSIEHAGAPTIAGPFWPRRGRVRGAEAYLEQDGLGG